MTLAHLSDEELLSSLSAVCFESRRLLARLLVHLNEIEERRLDHRLACSSLFDFCIKRLGMSENEAVRRIDAARLVKRLPCLLEHIECGDLHLTALLLLRDHFTHENAGDLARLARGKTKRELQEILAARAPRPDVLPTLTPLPATRSSDSAAVPSPAMVPPRLEPLAPSRHRLELTISDETRQKLERAKALRGGTLEDVLDKALDALLANVEKDRSRVRREVFRRDGERCTFGDARGNRCEARDHLELDHVVPRARGGSDAAENLRVVCRAHNQLYAEDAFGREHIQHRRREQALHLALRALTKMGFRERDARSALGRTFPPERDLPPMPDLLRGALRALAP